MVLGDLERALRRSKKLGLLVPQNQADLHAMEKLAPDEVYRLESPKAWNESFRAAGLRTGHHDHWRLPNSESVTRIQRSHIRLERRILQQIVPCSPQSSGRPQWRRVVVGRELIGHGPLRELSKEGKNSIIRRPRQAKV